MKAMNSKYWTIFVFMGLVWGSSLAQTASNLEKNGIKIIQNRTETINKLPARNIQAIASTVSYSPLQNEADDVTIRCGRGCSTNYYIDGIRVSGNLIPQETPETQAQLKTTPSAAAIKTEQPILITKIYPNPTSEALQVKLEEEVKYLLLSTSQGQIIKNFGPRQVGTTILNVAQFPTGHYFLKAIRADDAQTIHPIQITR